MVQTFLRDLRAFCSPIWVVLGFLFCSLVGLAISAIAGSSNGLHVMGRSWARFSLWAAGVHVDFEGEENIPQEGAAVFACNHASQFDILALYAALPLQFRFVVKKELFRIPFFGYVMRTTGYIPIDRSGGREAIRSLQAAAAQVQEGTSVVVFPEGTRSPDGRLRPFKVGGILLAIKAGCPVVPVAISGSHRVLPKGSFRVRPGRIRVKIGPPIPTVESGKPRPKEALVQHAWEAVCERLEAENRPAGSR